MSSAVKPIQFPSLVQDCHWSFHWNVTGSHPSTSHLPAEVQSKCTVFQHFTPGTQHQEGIPLVGTL